LAGFFLAEVPMQSTGIQRRRITSSRLQQQREQRLRGQQQELQQQRGLQQRERQQEQRLLLFLPQAARAAAAIRVARTRDFFI